MNCAYDIIGKIKRVKFDFMLTKLHNTVHEVMRAFANSIICLFSVRSERVTHGVFFTIFKVIDWEY